MRVIRQFTGVEWMTVVNHPWDVDECPLYDPREIPVVGDLRTFEE